MQRKHRRSPGKPWYLPASGGCAADGGDCSEGAVPDGTTLGTGDTMASGAQKGSLICFAISANRSQPTGAPLSILSLHTTSLGPLTSTAGML